MGIFFVLIVKRYNNLKYGGKLQTHYGTTWYPGSINPRAWSLGVKKKLENVYFNYYTRAKSTQTRFHSNIPFWFGFPPENVRASAQILVLCVTRQTREFVFLASEFSSCHSMLTTISLDFEELSCEFPNSDF